MKKDSNRCWQYYDHLLSLLVKHHHRREPLRQVHSHLITTAIHSYQYSNETAITLWNTLLRHYSLGDFPEEALMLYRHLHQLYQTISLDSFAYSFLLKSCANLKLSRTGIQLHGLTIKAGFEFNVYVQTALVNMYLVCGSVPESKQVFDEMPERNSVTWNVMITGLTNWGKLNLARSFFDMMPAKNVVSWTGLIDGYTQMNQPEEALSLFRSMVMDHSIRPTQVTMLAIYPAIWNLGYLELCQSIHTYGEKNGLYVSDIRVINSLIDAYAKCGSMESALRVFEGMSTENRTLVTWTSIISAFAMHGMAKEAVSNFKSMEEFSVKPNRVTYLSIFSACSHGGLVNEGLDFFRKMVNGSGIRPDIKHYGCLVDMLGRAGRLEEAEKMALNVPAEMANVVIWRTLLGACSYHNNAEMGKRVTRNIFELEREYAGDYVLLSNIFSGVGEYADSEKVRSVMDRRTISKVPGLSLV